MSTAALPIQLEIEAPDRHRRIAPEAEAALLDLLRLAAVLGGGRAALALRDRRRVWFRAAAGLGPGPWAGLAPLLAAAAAGAGADPDQVQAACGLAPLAQAPVPEGPDGAGGLLWVLGRPGGEGGGVPGPVLALAAGLVPRILALGREGGDPRARPRVPAGSSFVPGLVHELRNFSFGISASLDAFQACFGPRGEAVPFQRSLRTSLQRLDGFMEELRDYGDPAEPAWTPGDPERILRAAVDRCRSDAAAAGVALCLELDPPLPTIRMDEASLETALARLVGLALHRQGPGGRVTVRAGTGLQEGGPALAGHVEAAGMAFPGLDLDRLFEPFYFRAAGFGRLGLPVARRTLERHGGSLGAVPAPDGGVRLAFTLPALAG